ncbi:SDR family oxidoreductase [Capillimicrobium parvum]|uniref:Dihydroanticapsin 7-dehydrogenase n=1 Tax=Capillimicrobium parvum TaxID=2884022 RepID=A0A9E6XWI3_9ACTN|nr:SDR family oxidoreductase [Capillimicrobium parvum]UGS35771.1 Dihydroanticapsin 7-dehydrogenase [Capillimicrobium parvum]
MAPELALEGAVVVSGGASGLGLAVVRAVAEAGGTPVVLDRRASPDGFEGVEVDLVDARAAERAVAGIGDRFGGLRGVVTAAGIDACGTLDEVDGAEWDRVIAVNLVGTAAVVRAALPHLERAGGRVVTIASTLGLRALSDATAYCASKFGVVGFSRALAVEQAGRVGVTMVVPGGMDTAFFEGRPQQYKPGPDAALADPADVARTIVFALAQPAGFEIRELAAMVSTEPSWP